MFLRTLGCAVAATLTAVLAAGAPAYASEGFIAEELSYVFHYSDSDVVVTAGGPIEAFCGQAAPGATALRVFSRADGTDTLKAHGQQDQAIYVYEYAGGSAAMIGETCAAYSADPETEPPAAKATGTGLLKFTIEGIEGPADIGGFTISNSINGVATSPDGTRWKVRAWADFEVGEDGAPVGDPNDFQGASVRPIGP
jgi:hypothetical protein